MSAITNAIRKLFWDFYWIPVLILLLIPICLLYTKDDDYRLVMSTGGIGGPWFYTEVRMCGICPWFYVTQSMSRDKEDATEKFNNIRQTGRAEMITVLEQ